MPGPDEHPARVKAGAWPQLTIPPTAPAADRARLRRSRPPASSTAIEINVEPNGNRLASTSVAASAALPRPRTSSIRLLKGSIRPRASADKVERRRLPAKASSEWVRRRPWLRPLHCPPIHPPYRFPSSLRARADRVPPRDDLGVRLDRPRCGDQQEGSRRPGEAARHRQGSGAHQ